MQTLANFKQAAVAFFDKYSVLTHMLLMLWATFIATWATKASVVFYGFNINASAFVSWAQATLHLPTWAVGIVAFVFNAILMYSNFKTATAKQLEAKKTLGLVR